MFSSVILRCLVAVLIYVTIFATLGVLHDFPQLRKHIHKIRIADANASQRQWLALFYFVNEAGSGLKFFFTGNEKYMGHYPSFSHIAASRTAKAASGNWQMQLNVGRMYYEGDFVERDLQESLFWLYTARDNAASPQQLEQVNSYITAVEEEQQPAN